MTANDRPDADPRTTSAPAQPPAETASGQNTLPRAPAGAPSEPSTADHLAPAQQPGELGRLGPYRVLGVLGRGGMGVVYKAEEPALKRTVALKVMLPDCAANEHARRRFLREAEAQAAVEHEHIIPIYQVGEDAGVPFIAMPLLKGLTLSAALKQNPKPPLAHVVRIARETAEGLAAAHDAGLIHRDIKPGNIWLEGKRLKVRILDFGLARAEASDPTADPDGPLTATGAIVGTPAYMSPEQARGGPVDARTDLFSLGVMLYQMLTGAVPFKGPNALAILTALAVDDPAPVRAANPAVPERLERLVAALLSKTPDGRPASAEATADELRAIEDELTRPPSYSGSLPVVVVPVSAARAEINPWEGIDVSETGTVPIVSGILRRGAGAPAPAPEAPAPVAPEPRRAPPWAVLAAALLVLVAGGAFVAYKLVYDTPQGALVVEIDDPEVEARFKAGELKLYDKGGKLLYALKASERNKEQPAGQYKIEVTGADGLKVDVPEFKIERDGKVAVRISLDKRLVAKKDPPKKDAAAVTATDPHRRAAEAVIKNGFKATVRTSREERTVEKLSDLPNETFIVSWVPMVGSRMPDEALAAFEGIEYLSWMTLNGVGLTDAGTRHLPGVQGRSIDWSANSLSDASVKQLAGRTELLSLQIGGNPITDAAVDDL